jgi:hypothetical protein
MYQQYAVDRFLDMPKHEKVNQKTFECEGQPTFTLQKYQLRAFEGADGEPYYDPDVLIFERTDGTISYVSYNIKKLETICERLNRQL